MENIILNDFSGGMVENVLPTDFSPRQWAELKGFIPSEQGVMETQWAFQKVGFNSRGNGDFINMHAVSTDDGTFIFGIKSTGVIWFTRVGSTEQTQDSLLANVDWYPVQKVVGDDDYNDNINARFLCDIAFEANKYGYEDGEVGPIKVDNGSYVNEIVPGIVVGARVRPKTNEENAPSYRRTNAMYVLFMDPSKDWSVPSEAAKKWRVVSFPRKDRIRALNAPNDTDVKDLITTIEAYPYTYTDNNSTLRPGVGVIPMANVGTVWNNVLILGDIYWLRENAEPASPNDGSWATATGLFDDTVPFEGSVMHGESDIDIFDPRARLAISQTDASVQSLHVLNNTLVGITSYSGENDGVIAIRGNLDQLISYNASVRANPYAVRREILRGGLGFPARNKNNTNGQRRLSCMWPEAGILVFFDKMGGVFFTDSERVGRLDEFGPVEPTPIDFNDTIGAVGRHLFVWRNNRLFCLSMLGTGEGGSSGAWTEIALPPNGGGIRAMVGARDELYVLWQRTPSSTNYEIWRFSLNCPVAERGKYFSGTEEAPATADVELRVSTRTLAVDGESRDPMWHRFSMVFETPTSCTVGTVRIQAAAAKKTSIESLISNNKVGHKTWTLNRTFLNENEGEFVVPAAIGAQDQASATVTFGGYVRLSSATFTVSGSRMNRGEVPG